MSSAGAVAAPVALISEVAASGDIPLNTVKAMLNPRATPEKRMRVGKRSVSSTAKVPFVNPPQAPAMASTAVSGNARDSSA